MILNWVLAEATDLSHLQKCADWPSSPPSLLFNEHQELFLREGVYSGQGMRLASHLQLVPRLMSGAILLLPLYALMTCIRTTSHFTVIIRVKWLWTGFLTAFRFHNSTELDVPSGQICCLNTLASLSRFCSVWIGWQWAYTKTEVTSPYLLSTKVVKVSPLSPDRLTQKAQKYRWWKENRRAWEHLLCVFRDLLKFNYGYEKLFS